MALVLPRLPQVQPTHAEMQVWWQTLVEKIEEHNTKQDEILADQQSQLTEIRAVQRRDSISASYVVPSAILSASDAGTDATISIAAHTRHYGDETTLSVQAGTVTGLAYSTEYAIYYDDTTRADTTPTYQATTDKEAAQANYAAGRHLVGRVTTPAAGAADTSGDGSLPPGWDSTL